MNKFILIVLFLSQLAMAQTGNTTNAHVFKFSDTLEAVGLEDGLGVNSERAQYRWLLRASYDDVDKSLEDRQLRPSPLSTYIKNIRSVRLGGSYLFSKKFLLGVTLPIHSVLLDEQGSIVTGSGLDRKTVLGDASVHGKWRFTKDESPVNVALIPRVFLNTGDEKYLVSDDSFGLGLRVAADMSVGIVKIYSYLGYSNADNSVLANIDRRQLLEAALGFNISIAKKLALNLEFNADTNARNLDFKEDENRLNSLAALNYKLGKAHLYAGVDVQSFNRNRSDGVAYFAGFKAPFGPLIAPAPKPVAKPVVVKEEVKVEAALGKLNLARSIFYENDKAVILKKSFDKLDKAAAILVKYNDQYESLDIEGHTSSVGSRAYNKALSNRRAASVVKYLISKGVPANKLKAHGYGEERLKINPEVTREDYATNRRVEFVLKETIITD